MDGSEVGVLPWMIRHTKQINVYIDWADAGSLSQYGLLSLKLTTRSYRPSSYITCTVQSGLCIERNSCTVSWKYIQDSLAFHILQFSSKIYDDVRSFR